MIRCVRLFTCSVSSLILCSSFFFLFFFNDTATTEIYTLSLHDALPISSGIPPVRCSAAAAVAAGTASSSARSRSEEHTSELQSPDHLVCRLLLEKKKKKKKKYTFTKNN